jgi:flagellar hook protein FlgE
MAIEGIYAAISGLDANQEMLDVTSNNLANLNTVGYKAQTVDFADALSQVLRGAGGQTSTLGGTNPVEVGAGVNVQSVDVNEGTGTMQQTGNPLDVAIQGAGYLVVGDGQPNASDLTANLPTGYDYTRAGDLTTDAAGFLTTQSGQYVIGLEAQVTGTGVNATVTPTSYQSYIVIPPGSTNITIGTDGSIDYTDSSGSTTCAGYLALANFPNAQGLLSMGGNLYSPTQNSGSPTISPPDNGGMGQVVSGELEMSNVDLAAEFTNMITAQRGYDANAQVITVANQMLQALEQVSL